MLAQGISEGLSKFWMPVDEWTKKTLEDLLALDGSGVITTGWSKTVYDKFEAGKDAFNL
jgi:hypothetical protein